MEFKNYHYTAAPIVDGYDVSGMATSAANGHYSIVDSSKSGIAAQYTNGSYYLFYHFSGGSSEMYGWAINATIPNGGSFSNLLATKSEGASNSEDTPEGTWSYFTGETPTVTAGTIIPSATLFTVPEGKILIIGGVELNGGSSGGELTFTVNDGSADVFSKKLTLSADEPGDDSPLKLRHFVAGYSLKVKGSAAGMQVLVSAVEK